MIPTHYVVHHDPIKLRAFVESLLAEFESSAQARHVGLDALVFSDTLKGDVSLVRQLLTGLVGEAVRRAPAGTNVSLVVSPHGRYIEFRVADEGPGIAVGTRPKGLDAGAGGLREDGSGLTRCMLAAEANGGRLSVAETDAGTVVCLALPSQVGRSASNQPGSTEKRRAG